MVALNRTLFPIAGENDQAEQLAHEAVAVYDARPGPPDERYLLALAPPAAIQLSGADPEEGMGTARRMVDIPEPGQRAVNLPSFVPKTQIGIVLCILDRPEEAAPWLEEAYAGMQTQTGGRLRPRAFSTRHSDCWRRGADSGTKPTATLTSPSRETPSMGASTPF